MLFSIRLQFHLGPGPKFTLYHNSALQYLVYYRNFKLKKCIFEEYELKKTIFLRKEKEYRSRNSRLINLIKINCYIF